MKKILVVGMYALAYSLFAETAEEAYARISSYRSVWDTNAWAYAKMAAIGEDPALVEAKAKWFIDVLAFPDVTETNRLDEVLGAKRSIISWNVGSYGVESNTNCWYALADYIAHLKDVSDPRWIDERHEVITGYLDDGVAICANTNPLLNFASYKQEHYEEYKRQHTNLAEDDAFNAFHEEWRFMIRDKKNREYALKRVQDYAKQMMRDRFWLFGAKGLSDSEKAVCRSNIVERARLTPEEEHEIFEVIPCWFRGLGR